MWLCESPLLDFKNVGPEGPEGPGGPGGPEGGTGWEGPGGPVGPMICIYDLYLKTENI